MHVLANLDELAPDSAVAVSVPAADGATRDLVVIRNGDAVTAFENRCPHMSLPLNAETGRFFVKRGSLMCAQHGAMFDVTDGTCTWGPCKGFNLVAVPVVVVDGVVSLAG